MSCLQAAINLERNHASKIRHLAFRQIMLFKTFQTGKIDFMNSRDGFQGHGQRSWQTGNVPAYANAMSLIPRRISMALNGAHDCAGHIFHANQAHLINIILTAYNEARDKVAMAT